MGCWPGIEKDSSSTVRSYLLPHEHHVGAALESESVMIVASIIINQNHYRVILSIKSWCLSSKSIIISIILFYFSDSIMV